MWHTADRKPDVLEACDVGHRVVVRRRLTGHPRFTDLLGELVAIDTKRLVVRAEDGTEHTIAVTDVEAAKRIPARPARYSEIVELERVADRAWPPPVRESLGDWLLRATDGWTNRANSALPLGEADRPMAEAIEASRQWYEARGLTPKITVPLPVRRDVATALEALGWIAQPTVLVQTAPLVELTPMATASTTVDLTTTPSAEFLAIIDARKAGLPASARHVLENVPAVRFAEVRGEDGTLLGITRGAVVGAWMHVGLVEVVPSARRQGLARVMSAALAAWALEVGATRAVLQVEEINEAAVALFARLGFTTHHRYITFRATP